MSVTNFRHREEAQEVYEFICNLTLGIFFFMLLTSLLWVIQKYNVDNEFTALSLGVLVIDGLCLTSWTIYLCYKFWCDGELDIARRLLSETRRGQLNISESQKWHIEVFNNLEVEIYDLETNALLFRDTDFRPWKSQIARKFAIDFLNKKELESQRLQAECILRRKVKEEMKLCAYHKNVKL